MGNFSISIYAYVNPFVLSVGLFQVSIIFEENLQYVAENRYFFSRSIHLFNFISNEKISFFLELSFLIHVSK